MDKGIGFCRTIKLDWMDITASLCVQKKDPIFIRQYLAEAISNDITGTEAKRKTIDVLSAIWVKTEKTDPQIRQDALMLFPTLSSSDERLWLHYGMTLVRYPFFRNCVAAIGQISRSNELITKKMIKDRIAGIYGHLGGLDRSVERTIASLLDWGTLTKSSQTKEYQIVLRHFSSSAVLQSWLLTCALYAFPADALLFEDLIHLPELCPFKITIGLDSLRKDPRFEVHRQGGGFNMVKIATG